MTNEDFMDMYDDYLMHANRTSASGRRNSRKKYNDSPSYEGNEQAYNQWYYQNVTKPKKQSSYGANERSQVLDTISRRRSYMGTSAYKNKQASYAQAQAATRGGERGRERQRQENVRRIASRAFIDMSNANVSNAQAEAARGRRRSALTRNSAANVSNEERRSRYKTNMRKRKFAAGINRIKSSGNKIAKQLKNQWDSHLDNFNIGMDELSNMIKRAKTSRKKRK